MYHERTQRQAALRRRQSLPRPESKAPRTRMCLGGRVALVALIVLLIAVATPNAGAQTTTPSTTAASKFTKITVSVKASENNLTPFTVTLLALPTTNDLVHLVYDSLFWSQVKQNPEAWLALSATPSPDRTTWTVKLRPGVMWQDGVPLTASDVAFTYNYNKGVLTGRYSHHVWQWPILETAVALDPLTVQFTFKGPAPTFNIMPGADLPIVPQHIWQNIKNPTLATTMLPIGSGPYRVTQIVPNQSYKLVANPSYFKGKPTVDEIDMPIVTDPTATFAALQTGQLDSTDRSVPPELFNQLSHTPGIAVVKSTRMESVELHFNDLKAPLSDARLRKGITLAIDTNALVQTVLLGHGLPGRDGWVHPASPWADPNGGHEFNVAKGNQMLDAAGYPRGPDGIRRTPAGAPLSFAISVAANEPQHVQAVQLMAQQVAAVGVKFTLNPLDPATLRQQRNTGSYDGAISNLESHAHADPDALFFFFHSMPPGPGQALFGGYSNPKFDALVDQAKMTIDINQRKQLLYQAQTVFAQDAPTQVLFYPEGDYAYRTAAYNGWVEDPGQGILTVRSFLPGYAKLGGASSSSSSSGPPWAVIGLIVGVVVVVGGGLVLRNRRRQMRSLEEA